MSVNYNGCYVQDLNVEFTKFHLQCVRTFQTNLSPSSRLLSFVTFWGKQHRKQFETLMKFVQSFFFLNCIWNDLPHKKKTKKKKKTHPSFVFASVPSRTSFISVPWTHHSEERKVGCVEDASRLLDGIMLLVQNKYSIPMLSLDAVQCKRINLC